MIGLQNVLNKIKKVTVREAINNYRKFEPVSDEIKFILHLAELEADRLSISDMDISEAIQNWHIGAIKYFRKEVAHDFYYDTDSVKEDT